MRPIGYEAETMPPNNRTPAPGQRWQGANPPIATTGYSSPTGANTVNPLYPQQGGNTRPLVDQRTGLENPNAALTGKDGLPVKDETGSWMTLVILALFVSVGGNFYTVWIAMDVYRRYRDLAYDLTRTQRDDEDDEDDRRRRR